MLLSLKTRGEVGDAIILVFLINANDSCLKVIKKHNVRAVFCNSSLGLNIDSKAIVYNVLDIVDADKFIFIDETKIEKDEEFLIYFDVDEYQKK
jgi:hypothetical protein